MTTAKDVLKMIKEKDVKYVDFRFTDPRGKWQHVTFDVGLVDEEAFSEGLMFDGSSIAGWKAINESDMKLMPDPGTACVDPFFAQTTLSIVCDILEPLTDEPYDRDPRSIAKKAEDYLKQTKIGDSIFFGPEAEFFVFDDVKFSTTPYNTGFRLDDVELPTNSDTDYEMGNLGHRIGTKKGYFPVPPLELLAGHALRDARCDGLDGRQGREAPSRGRFRAARAGPEVRSARHHGGSPAGL